MSGPMSQSLVRLDSVALSYDGSPVLTGVDLDLRGGDFVGVVGPSGAGKTTLLRLALGTLRPTSGRVERARGLRVGYVPQLDAVSWSFPVTVAECVLMVRSERWLPWATRAEKRAVAEVLDLLGHLHDDGVSILLTTHDLNGVAAHVPDLVAMNGTVVRRGAPAEVMTPEVLEQTFGAPLEVMEHLGMPVVLDRKRVPTRAGVHP